MTAGLFSRASNTNKTVVSQSGYDQETLNNIALAGDPSNIGVATKWVNPYVTRFKVTEKTSTTSTTTTTKRTTTIQKLNDEEEEEEEEERLKIKRSIIDILRRNGLDKKKIYKK